MNPSAFGGGPTLKRAKRAAAWLTARLARRLGPTLASGGQPRSTLAGHAACRLSPLLIALGLLAGGAQAEIVVRDDSGRELRLPAPARRIVSLAPHLTETAFAAGAGGQLVGVVEYSDFPAAARQIKRVGSYNRIDLEAVAALKPDLVLAWESGNLPGHLDKLRALGIPVFLTQPNRIMDVPGQLERIGQLAGSQKVGDAAARDFRQRLARLQQQFGSRPAVRVFYQVWKQPLLTVGGPQIISDAIRICGGTNVFGDLQQLAPTVSVEAVLATQPEAIIASGMDESRPEWLDDWRQWPALLAMRRNNLFHINPDLVQRHTPRLLDGTEQLCQHLETARSRR